MFKKFLIRFCDVLAKYHEGKRDWADKERISRAPMCGVEIMDELNRTAGYHEWRKATWAERANRYAGVAD